LSEEINRGQMMFRRERDNSRRLEIGQSIAKDDDCIGVLGGGRGLRRPLADDALRIVAREADKEDVMAA
jgi:hypothetical protein